MNEHHETANDATPNGDDSAKSEDDRIVGIEDRRDELVRKLEAAWQRALGDFFAERRAA